MSSRLQLCCAVLLLTACSATGQNAADEGSSSQALATVDGKELHVEDLGIRGELISLEQQIYDAKMQGIDQKIAEILIEKAAAERGVSADELVALEVGGKVEPPTDAEVEAFYAQQR